MNPEFLSHNSNPDSNLAKKLKRRSRSREVLESKVRLVNSFSLIILTLTSAIALWLVSPSRTTLLTLLAESSSPDVALAFLYALDGSVKDDKDVKNLMFKNHLLLNELDKAEAIILPLLKDENGMRNWPAFVKYLKLLMAQYASATNVQEKNKKFNEIKELFNKTIKIPSAEIARVFADAALEMGFVKKAYQYLLQHSNNSSVTNQDELLNLALQFSNYEAAIKHKEKIIKNKPTLRNFRQLLNLYTAANKHEEAYNFIKQYIENTDNDYGRKRLLKSSDFLILVLKLALTKNDELLVKNTTDALINRNLNDIQLSKIIDAGVANGFLGIALTASEIKAKKYPTQKNIKEAHDIAIWNGDIYRALELTKIRVANSPSEVNIRQAIKEAVALGDYSSQQYYFQLLNKKGYLLLSELDSLIKITELTKGTPAALTIVDDFIKKLKETSSNEDNIHSLLLHKARLLNYLSKYKEIETLWRKLSKLFPNKNNGFYALKNIQVFADANISLGRPDRALSILLTDKNWLDTDMVNLEKIFSLAWETGDKQTAIKTLDELNARADYDVSGPLNGYRYIQLHQPFESKDIPLLISLSEKWNNDQLLMIAINLAYKNGDYTLLDSLLDKVMNNPRYANDERLLYFSALSAMKQNDHEKVKKLFAKLLTKLPKDDSVINSYIWWLIDQNELVLLEDIYNRYKLTLQDNPSFWLVFSSASQKLKKYREAEFWLKRLLVTQDNVSVNAILNYAQLMELKDENETAFRLRRYVVENLSKELLDLEPDKMSFISMVNLFSGERFALPILEQKVAQNPTQQGTVNLFSYYLKRKDYQRLSLLNEERFLGKFKLPDWQQMSIALLEKDENKVKQLIMNSLQLPIAQKNYAMQKLGGTANSQRFNNWQHGEQSLSPKENRKRQSELRQVHINQHPSHSKGFAFDFTSFTYWGVNQASVKYYQPFDSGWWDVSLIKQKADTPNVIFGHIIDDEQRIVANAHWKIDWFKPFFEQNQADMLSVKLDLADGEGDLRDGVFLALSVGVDDRLQTNYSLGINQAFEQSQFANLAAKNDLIGFGCDYFITARETLTFRTNLNKIKTRFDDFIAKGWDYSFRLTESLFSSDPGWNIYMNYSHQQYWFGEEDLLRINNFYNPINEIVPSDFVDKKFARLAMGQRLFHGEPNLPGSLKPSPTYWLDTSFGINPINQQTDLTISSGVGMRLFGDDELSVKLDWQSRDINGDRSFKFSLGYYYNL